MQHIHMVMNAYVIDMPLAKGNIQKKTPLDSWMYNVMDSTALFCFFVDGVAATAIGNACMQLISIHKDNNQQ